MMNLLLGEEEEIIEGLGRGGVPEGDVDDEIGTNVVICTPCKWTRLVLGLDYICWLYNMWCAMTNGVGSCRVGYHERGTLHCI